MNRWHAGQVIRVTPAGRSSTDSGAAWQCGQASGSARRAATWSRTSCQMMSSSSSTGSPECRERLAGQSTPRPHCFLRSQSRPTPATAAHEAALDPIALSSRRPNVDGRWPELRRTLTTSSGRAPARTSSRPLRTVLIARPVALATAATPPYPIASASAPAHNLRDRSSMVAFSRRHFWRTVPSASTPNVDHGDTILSTFWRTRLDRLVHSRALSPTADSRRMHRCFATRCDPCCLRMSQVDTAHRASKRTAGAEASSIRGSDIPASSHKPRDERTSSRQPPFSRSAQLAHSRSQSVPHVARNRELEALALAVNGADHLANSSSL